MTSRTRVIVMSLSAPGDRLRDRRRIPRPGDGARRHTYPAPQDLRRRGQPDFEQLRRRSEHRQGDARRDARPRRRPRSGQRLPDRRRSEAGRSRRGAAAGGVGLELTRQYYLRVIAARDNSPAAKAGLRTGDYIRAINDTPTREMSVWEGVRALRGARRLESLGHDHPRQRRRSARRRADARTEPASTVNGRIAAPGIGYVRVAALGAEHGVAGEDRKSPISPRAARRS